MPHETQAGCTVPQVDDIKTCSYLSGVSAKGQTHNARVMESTWIKLADEQDSLFVPLFPLSTTSHNSTGENKTG